MQPEGFSMDGVWIYELVKLGIPIHVQFGNRVYRW